MGAFLVQWFDYGCYGGPRVQIPPEKFSNFSGEVPGPQQNVEFAFVTIDLMCGVLIFATIVGNVGRSVVSDH